MRNQCVALPLVKTNNRAHLTSVIAACQVPINLETIVQTLKKYIKFICDKCRLTNEGLIDTWDYQLSFLLLEQNILNIVPCKSLAENIGFDKDATHTKEKRPSYAQKVYQEIKLDKEIDINFIDYEADKAVQRLIYTPGIRMRIKRKIYKWLN